MKIKYWMTPAPLTTISPDAPISEAARLMKERSIHRLPVLEGGRLAGLITYRDILEAQPSPATSLSIHELRYLSAQILVRDVMRKNPVTVSPDDQVTAVMLLGRERGLSSFPVMDGGRLVGIITASDLFELFLDILGRETRNGLIGLTKEGLADDMPSGLAEITAVLSPAAIAVKTFLDLPLKTGPIQRRYFIRVEESQAQAATQLLIKAGFKLIFQD